MFFLSFSLRTRQPPVSAFCARVHARLLLFRLQEKMAAISPTERHIVPYVAYFSSAISFKLEACWRPEEHLKMLLSATQRRHPYISRGG